MSSDDCRWLPVTFGDLWPSTRLHHYSILLSGCGLNQQQLLDAAVDGLYSCGLHWQDGTELISWQSLRYFVTQNLSEYPTVYRRKSLHVIEYIYIIYIYNIYIYINIHISMSSGSRTENVWTSTYVICRENHHKVLMSLDPSIRWYKIHMFRKATFILTCFGLFCKSLDSCCTICRIWCSLEMARTRHGPFRFASRIAHEWFFADWLIFATHCAKA